MAICRGLKGHEHLPKVMPRYVRLCDECRKLKGERPSQAYKLQDTKRMVKLKDLPADGIGGARRVLDIMLRIAQ